MRSINVSQEMGVYLKELNDSDPMVISAAMIEVFEWYIPPGDGRLEPKSMAWT
jgi:hypothetical protein